MKTAAKNNNGPVEVILPGRRVTERQMLDWIESGEPRSEIDILVTPVLANLVLRFNTPGETNRHLLERVVRDQAAQIIAGTWNNTGEPVIVSDAKLLNDGQHRLTAVVASGQPAIMDFRFGVPREAFYSTNTGRHRSAGDALSITGIRRYHAVAASARMVLNYRAGLPGAAHAVRSNAEIVEAVQRWPGIVTSMNLTGNLRYPFRSVSVHALAFFADATANESVVEEFFLIVRTGTGNSDNPAHRWRETVIRQGGSRDRTERAKTLADGIIAWNEFRKPPAQRKPFAQWRSTTAFPVVDGLKL